MLCGDFPRRGPLTLNVMEQALTLPLFISAQLMVARPEVYGVRLDTRGNTPWYYDAYVSK